jgi:hypothetical protein
MADRTAQLVIVPDLENYWKGSPPAKLIDVTSPIVVGGLEGGMESGLPSIGIIIELDEDTAVFARTSLKLFLMAADTLKRLYGDPRVDPSGPAA